MTTKFTKIKSLSLGLVASLVFMLGTDASIQARPQYYTGLSKVTPAVVNGEKVVMIDLGGQVAMVKDRPVRTHEIVDPAQMVQFVNASGDIAAVILRPYRGAHQHRYEFIPQGPWVLGPDGIQLNTGIKLHDCKHKHHDDEGAEKAHEGMPEEDAKKVCKHKAHHKHHHKAHHAFWQGISQEKSDNLMTATILTYRGEGEKNFFVTPKEFQFSKASAGEGHATLKVVAPVVESLAVKKHGCPKCKHHHAAQEGQSACVESKHMRLHDFDKLWKAKGKDSFGKDNPNAFIWAGVR